eukprot:Pgem_evm1s11316
MQTLVATVNYIANMLVEPIQRIKTHKITIDIASYGSVRIVRILRNANFRSSTAS